MHLGDASWSTPHTAVITDRRLRSVGEFVLSSARGVIIAGASGEFGVSPVLLDVVAARKQIRNRVMTIPRAFQADDLTLGILWALCNLDESLLNDDSALDHIRQRVRIPADLDDSMNLSDGLAQLSPVSYMWLGSVVCARFIISSTHDFFNRPIFWTREQCGEEASAWLFFRHKLDYLVATSKRFTDSSGSTSRTFCVPEQVVRDSLPVNESYCCSPRR